MTRGLDANFFDYASTSPPLPQALDEYVKVCQEYFGNPSSTHSTGSRARGKLLALRKQVCDLIHFPDGRLLLTSSASEANSTIIEGHLKHMNGAHLLIVEDVHDSIWYARQKHLKATTVHGIQNDGSIDSKEFEKAIKKGISMVCLSHVCHETGTIHPVKELANLCNFHKVKMLIDGSQAVGHIPVTLQEIPCAYYTFSGHKFGAPKGIGGALIRDGEFEPRIFGGKQQWNLRAGTEDLAGLAAMAKALECSLSEMEAERKKATHFRNLLISELTINKKIRLNSPQNGSPEILSLSVRGISGHELAGALSLAGYLVSKGAACQSNQMDPSRILLAMGRSHEDAIGCLRISLGRGNSEESLRGLISAILEIIN